MKTTQEQIDLFESSQHVPEWVLRSRFADNFYNRTDQDDVIQEGMQALWKLCTCKNVDRYREKFIGVAFKAVSRRYMRIIRNRMRTVKTIRLSELCERHRDSLVTVQADERLENVREAILTLEAEELELLERVFYLRQKIKTIAREVESTGFKVQRQLEKTLARLSMAYGVLTGVYDGLIMEPKWRGDMFDGGHLTKKQAKNKKRYQENKGK